MATCPVCGKEISESKEFVFNEKKLVNLCSTCHSFLVCLTKPVSFVARKNAQTWAKETLKTCNHPYVSSFIKVAYDFSLKAEGKDAVNGSPEENIGEDTPSNPFQNDSLFKGYLKEAGHIKTGNTKIVKIISILSTVFFSILGAFILNPIFDDGVGIIVGFFAGFFIGIILDSFVMMFVEISENTAIQARSTLRTEESTLRTEQMIAEMNERDKIAKGINK